MASILALLPEDIAFQRLDRAVRLDESHGARNWLQRASSTAEIALDVASGPWDLIVLDPRAWLGSGNGVKEFRQWPRGVPAVLYADFARIAAADVIDLAQRLRAADVWTLGVDDEPFSLLPRIHKCLGFMDCRAAFTPFLSRFDQRVREYLLITLEASVVRISVEQLARRCFSSPRTLRRRFGGVGLAMPGTVISVCRVLRAGVLLQLRDRPVASVATALGFGTAENLRHHFRRHAGLSPATVRSHNSLAHLMEAVTPALLE